MRLTFVNNFIAFSRRFKTFNSFQLNSFFLIKKTMDLDPVEPMDLSTVEVLELPIKSLCDLKKYRYGYATASLFFFFIQFN